MKNILKACLVGCGALLLSLGALLLFWYVRPNASIVDPALGIESWDAVRDGSHNSNTDMIFWRGSFYLVHASSPFHFASEECRLVVRRSPDARTWEKLAEIRNPGQDIRDPKFAVFGGRLFLYVLKNTAFEAEPYGTALTTSADGKTWTRIRDIEPKGWLFWRPKTRDGRTWYLPAYSSEHGKAALLSSGDGEHWNIVSMIFEGERCDETDIEFLPGGRMISTSRLEVSDSVFGDRGASTWIGLSGPPYTKWSGRKSFVTRLDGPSLFSYRGDIYAVGRHNPQRPCRLFWFGSILGKKRTSLYRLTPEKLAYLSDLPSAGDTSYSGVVMKDGNLFISYYTSPVNRDYPWIMGMVSASDIRIAKVPLEKLRGAGAGK